MPRDSDSRRARRKRLGRHRRRSCAVRRPPLQDNQALAITADPQNSRNRRRVAKVGLTRVLYGLKAEHYDGFARHQLPHGHEFFTPMDALTAVDSDKNPEMEALLQRASPVSNFMRQR